MEKDLRITLIQAKLLWEDVEGNLDLFEAKLGGVGETDLILLPEMFNTGFTMNAAPLAEEADGRTMQWMSRLAAETKAVICGSIIIQDSGHFYNRLVWMRQDGTYELYDKRHLFSLAKENRTYTAGKDRLIVKLSDWTIYTQICYDLRFPVWSRNVDGYDVLVNVANWPEKRKSAWKTLLRARAIENQCFVAGLNRVGDDGHGVYHSGDSAIIDPMGETIWELSDEEGLSTVNLSRSVVYETRRKFPFLSDRDQFQMT
jgi:predicted amidohydrolase